METKKIEVVQDILRENEPNRRPDKKALLHKVDIRRT